MNQNDVPDERYFALQGHELIMPAAIDGGP